MMQVELTDVLAEVDPEIFLFQVLEVLAGAAQHLLAIAVDGVGLNAFRRSAGLGGDPFLQLTRGVPHIGDAEDLAGGSQLLANESRDTLHQDGRFTRACIRNHQHGAALVLYGELLLRVGGEEHTKVLIIEESSRISNAKSYLSVWKSS